MILQMSAMCRVWFVSLCVNDEKCVPSAVVSYAPWSSSRALGSRRRKCLQQGFPSRGKDACFWHLLNSPVIGGQAYRIPPISKEEWEEKKDLFDENTGRIRPNAEMSSRARSTTEYVMKQFSVSFVEDKFGLDNAIQTKASFSYAIAGMDRVGRWEEEEGERENLMGARFAASI